MGNQIDRDETATTVIGARRERTGLGMQLDRDGKNQNMERSRQGKSSATVNLL